VLQIDFEWFFLVHHSSFIHKIKKEEMKRTVLVLCMMVAMAVTGYAQQKVEGFVRDRQSGEPIAGVQVLLGNSYRSTFTDAQGRFHLQKMVPGEYTLKITHVAYDAYEGKVIVADVPVLLEITMEPSIHLSEAFVVTAVRAEERSSGAATTIRKEELRQANLGQDIPYLLSTMPSTVITSDAGMGIGYTGIRIRGVDQNRINVTINGIPLNDPESHAVYWVDLPDFASSIEDIQIQRGVGTSTNGAGAFGGSVNILTEKLNQKPHASMNHTFGSFNTMKNSLNFGTGMINQHYVFDGRISRIVSDGYIDRASSDLLSAYFAGGYYGKRTILKGIISTGKEVTYQAWGGVAPEVLDTNRTWNPQGLYFDGEGNLKAYDNQVDDYLQTHYQLHVTHQINKMWSANGALHLTTGTGYYESYKSNRKLVSYGLPIQIAGGDTITRTDMIQRKWLDNRFYGATASLVRTCSGGTVIMGGAINRYDGDHFGTMVWLQHASGVPKDFEWYRGDGSKLDGNIYIKMSRQLTSKLTVFGDIQYRHIDYTITGTDDDLRDIGQHHRYGFWNPKAGATLMHNDRHESWLTGGIANREPNRSNFTDAGAEGKVPQAERLFNLEAGHQFKQNRFSATVNFYWMYYHDQLVMTGEINDVGSPVMTNVARSYRAGIELIAGARLTKWLEWEANVTISSNKILDFTTYVDDFDTTIQRVEHLGKTDIAFSPALIGNHILRFKPLPHASIALVSQYVGKQYLDNTASAERMLDSWFLTHIQFQYEMKVKGINSLRFNLMCNNIFDAQYISNGWVYRYYYGGQDITEQGLFPQAGFHLLGGVTVQF
jgi:iron complex outermembrane recepter protein